MKKFPCVRIKGDNTLCEGSPVLSGSDPFGNEGPFFYYCEECGEESVTYARPIEALKNWNHLNRFPEWYKDRVLEVIIRNDRAESGTYFRDIVEKTAIPEIFIKRILKDQKEKGNIYSDFLVSMDGDPGYYGRGYMSSMSREMEDKILKSLNMEEQIEKPIS